MQGFWAVVALMMWNGVITFAGIMTAASFPGGWVWIWIGGNVVLAFFLNKTRKHSDAERYDDRGTPQEMSAAMERWVHRTTGDEPSQGFLRRLFRRTKSNPT